MKAITYSSDGPPDVLQLKDVEKPEPKEDGNSAKTCPLGVPHVWSGAKIIGQLEFE